MKLNRTDNGNGQMAIIDENLRCVAFIPKLHPDSELYIKKFENVPKMLELLNDIYAWAEQEQSVIGEPPFLHEIDELIEKLKP